MRQRLLSPLCAHIRTRLLLLEGLHRRSPPSCVHLSLLCWRSGGRAALHERLPRASAGDALPSYSSQRLCYA